MGNEDLRNAKDARKDEFYTQYVDIEKEINSYLDFDPDAFRNKVVFLPCDDPEWSNFTKFFAQNFQRLGLSRLISTSYAPNSKPVDISYQPGLFELEDSRFDADLTRSRGKLFSFSRDNDGNGKIDIDDLEWTYLEGTGDFRSDEVKSLRDQADIIVTNPPFSLFREFFSWLLEGQKKFVVLGNMNSVGFHEVFDQIMRNQVWLGPTISSGDREFRVPENYPLEASGWRVDEEGNKFLRVKGVRWFTNLDHGRRHEPLSLMTMEKNLRYSKHKTVIEFGYLPYENYDAIEIPFTDSIPADYKGVMGVPITFLDKYSPDQFEILGRFENKDIFGLKTRLYSTAECKMAYQAKFGKPGTYDLNRSGVVVRDGLQEQVYTRILIRHKGTN